jgi:hypothetical protein
MKGNLKYIIAAFFILFLFGIVGKYDQAEEKTIIEIYCKNVALRIWPDYKQIYARDCKNIFPK